MDHNDAVVVRNDTTQFTSTRNGRNARRKCQLSNENAPRISNNPPLLCTKCHACFAVILQFDCQSIPLAFQKFIRFNWMAFLRKTKEEEDWKINSLSELNEPNETHGMWNLLANGAHTQMNSMKMTSVILQVSCLQFFDILKQINEIFVSISMPWNAFAVFRINGWVVDHCAGYRLSDICAIIVLKELVASEFSCVCRKSNTKNVKRLQS